jgi:hypothetical protein
MENRTTDAVLTALDDARSALVALERRSVRRTAELTDRLVEARKQHRAGVVGDAELIAVLGEVRREALRFTA